MDQLTNQNGACPAVVSAIADAEAQIDSYISRRYQLPLQPPIPALIRRCACELTRYFLWDDKSTDHVRIRYEDAVGLLTDISVGNVLLPIPEVATTDTSKAYVMFKTGQNVWKRGPLV